MTTIYKRRGKHLEIYSSVVIRMFRLDKITSMYVFLNDVKPYLGFAIHGDEEPWSIDFPTNDEAIAAMRDIADMIDESPSISGNLLELSLPMDNVIGLKFDPKKMSVVLDVPRKTEDKV
ncbi:MAG TPA: hypothetical protein PL124_07200 [Candidatus Cloacimonadota bacterium]|nr:hypothetical protein [Candidatus Cloacimonadota bacterium]